jgi:hypothetical protein
MSVDTRVPPTRSADRESIAEGIGEGTPTPVTMPDVVVAADGDPSVLKNAAALLQALKTEKAPDAIKANLDTLGKTFIDYTQDPEFVDTFSNTVDFSLIRMSLDKDRVKVDHPPDAAKVVPAAQSLIKAKRSQPLLTTLMPADPDKVETKVKRLILVRGYKASMQRGFTAAEAEETHLEQELYDELSSSYKPIAGALPTNSTLSGLLGPLDSLFNDKFAKGLETRRKIENALNKEREKNAQPGTDTTGSPGQTPGPGTTITLNPGSSGTPGTATPPAPAPGGTTTATGKGKRKQGKKKT